MPQYHVEHHSVSMPLISQPLLGIIAVIDRNGQESNHYDPVRSGHLAEH
jgi:hypothetical protein